ncbi:MAG TPA: hypothetical protein VFQ68_21985, partial [Streptosporangiaceae bacterium]|nr:hypothetical protein [Streptosporangiaceae bacterium]
MTASLENPRPPNRISQRPLTGRRASHNTVEGFIRQLLGQLSDLLGRPVPTVTPPGGWEEYLLELLPQ